jgi:hypothetical protein
VSGRDPFWVDRWRRLLPPPDDAELRAERLERDLARHRALQADMAAVEAQLPRLLAATVGGPGDLAVRHPDPPRPHDTAVARSFKLANGTVIGIEEFFDARNFPRLRQQFADADATLVIDEIPVNDRAVGRVFSVQMGSGAPPAANADPSGVRVAAGERVEVTVGRQARPDERVTTEGLTLFEVFPEVEHAIVRDDAVASGRAAGVGIQDSMVEVMTSREAHEQLGH